MSSERTFIMVKPDGVQRSILLVKLLNDLNRRVSSLWL